MFANIRKPPPIVFSAERRGRRIYYSCNKVRNFNGKILKCTYSVRQDHFDEKSINHSCVFNYSKSYKDTKIKEISTEEFQKKVFEVIGKLNISIRAATSTCFKSLLEMAYKCGQNNKIPFNQFYCSTSRRFFTNKFVNE